VVMSADLALRRATARNVQVHVRHRQHGMLVRACSVDGHCWAAPGLAVQARQRLCMQPPRLHHEPASCCPAYSAAALHVNHSCCPALHRAAHRVCDAGACRQVLHSPAAQGLLVAHAVLVAQLAVHHIGEDLSVAVGVGPAAAYVR
jgi:hypothetical protein